MVSDMSKYVLKCNSVVFYSTKDEEAFFEWLDKIDAIELYEGSGYILSLHVREQIREDDLRELIALFVRYAIPLNQLKVFDLKRFSHWFRDRNSFWYDGVFE
jgi:hypothetical protein